jgi:hypothetical protein
MCWRLDMCTHEQANSVQANRPSRHQQKFANKGTIRRLPLKTYLLTLPQTKVPTPSCTAPLAGPARPATAAGVLGAPRLARLADPPSSGMVLSC